jgi:hypothetical protein
MDVVLVEFTVVGALVGPEEVSMTVLHALLIAPVILCTIGPLLGSIAVLLVKVPLSFIPASVEVCVDSHSMGLVIKPLTFVHISFCVD